MRDETAEQPAPLRSGLTTGSCATATSLAAARLLLSGVSHDAVAITLPKGKVVTMRLEFCRTHQSGRPGTDHHHIHLFHRHSPIKRKTAPLP